MDEGVVSKRKLDFREGNKYIFEEAQLEGDGQEHFEAVNGNVEKKLTEARYRELCSLSNQLATRASLPVETFQIGRKGLLKLIEEVDAILKTSTKINAGQKAIVSKVGEDVHSLSEITAKELKQKEKKHVKSGKRLQSGSEKNQQKSRRSNACVQKKYQENEAVGNNSDMILSSQQSSFSYVDQFQVLRFSIKEYINNLPLHHSSRKVHPIKTSLTYMLQQQLVQPHSSREFHVNDFSHGNQDSKIIELWL